MSSTATEHLPESDLVERVEALRQAAELARPHLPADEIAVAELVIAKAGDRLRHGTRHTVVAVAGATGSGKSSIVNRVAGAVLSEASVLRPTTSATHAIVWGHEDAGPLLDWLEISRRHQIADGAPALAGLVLLDLPDHDSTAVEHRMEVDRLVALVDVLIWVTDPQKYADEALHHGYIRPLADHAQILRFVLNQVDRLEDRGEELAADLRRLLMDDGIDAPLVVPVSALDGGGFEDLHRLLVDAVADRRAALDRIGADVSAAASGLHREVGSAETGGRNRRDLVTGLAEAAGSAETASVAAAHHRRNGTLAMGWPFTRFIRRWGRKPLAELPGPGRGGAASTARADLAVRDYCDAVAADLEPPWPAAVRAAAASERDALLDDLRSSVGSAAVAAGRRPRWWSIVAWLQRVVATTAVVGLVWLVAVAVLGGFFRFDTEPLLPDTPGADWIPIPSLLLLGGVVIGLVIGFLVRFPLGIASARRGRTARKTIEDDVSERADIRVVELVGRVLADQRRVEELLTRARG